MPNEIKGTDAVSASPDADSLFYLLKIAERGEIGNRDPDGSVKEFFDIEDIAVIQSTALLQDFNTDEFIEIPGQVNDKWVNGDGSWGGLNGLSLLVPESPLGGGIMMPKLEATWTAGATDADTELNAALAIKTAYEGFNVESSTFPTVGFVAANLFTHTDGNIALGLTPEVMWTIYGSQIKNLLKSSIPDLNSATQASDIVTVLDAIIGGKSFTFQPGSNFKFVDSSSSNVIQALNNFYGPNTSIQKDLVNDPTSLKDFSTVKNFVETQIDRTTNFFGNVFNSPTFWNEYKALTNTTNLTTGVAQNFLLIQEITGQLSTGLSFTSLSDTPTGYDDGKILQSTATGLKWVDMPVGGADSVDDITDLPNNPADGQLISVGCDLYIGCNGEWVKVGADAIAPPTEAPACVSNLEEYNQYTEYKDQFLADNTSASFDAGLNNQTNIHDFIHDVCLFADSNLSQERNTVVIDETTFKWGMFAGDQNINITAQAFSDPNIGSCTFKEWRSNSSGFPKTNAQETIFIDQDASITGCFECSLQPQHPSCSEIELFLQPTIAGGSITDRSSYERVVTPQGDPIVDNAESLFTQPTINFDGNGDSLEVGDNTTFKWINNYSSPFTIECWVYIDQITTDWLGRRSIHFLSTNKASSDGHGFLFYVNTDGITFIIHNGVGQNVGVGHVVSNADILDKWMHLAATWDGETMCLYVDGSLKSSSTPSTVPVNNNNSHNMLKIGHTTPSAPANTIPHLNGHIQDIRISKKVVYTNNFATPVTLLENPCPDQPSCNQVSLHLQPDTGEAIADKSDNQHAVTTGGNAVADSTAILFGGGTINLAGNGDFLSIGDTSTFKFLHDDTTDYTIEFWLKLDQVNQFNNILATIATASSEVGVFSNVRQDGQFYYHIHRGDTGTTFKEINSQVGAISAGTWNHAAFVNKVGQDLKLYLNGQSISDQGSSFTTVAAPSTSNSKSALHIGASSGKIGVSPGPMNGQIQDFRISKKAVYTTNFTPPTTLLANPC